MSTNYSGSFCQDAFWDLSVTWYTENPDFTTCFHQTALVYIPSVILLASASLTLYYASASKNRLLPWCPTVLAKIGLNALLIFLTVTDLFYAVKVNKNDDPDYVYPVHWVASLVKCCSFSVALALLLLCVRKGIVASGTLFLYWALEALFGAVTFRY